jgi:hypothetical protein
VVTFEFECLGVSGTSILDFLILPEFFFLIGFSRIFGTGMTYFDWNRDGLFFLGVENLNKVENRNNLNRDEI